MSTYTLAFGIDPGLTGAVVSFDITGPHPRISHISKMPTEPKLNGKGRQVNAAGFSVDILAHMQAAGVKSPDAVLVCGLEQVHAMPGQGVTAMFSFGRSLGVLEGCLGALRLPVMHIRPNDWKKRYKLAGVDRGKEASLAMFQQLQPQWDITAYTKPVQIGIADAYFIGRTAMIEMANE